MAKLMDVSDQDVAIIEDTIAERLELGVSQAQAQRQAVDEALAQLAEERSMVMRAIDEQLGTGSKDEPYSDAPDNLMGYRRNGPQKSFGESNYKHVEFVRVTWPDGDSIVEAMRGLNRPHAIERARRNWKDAEVTRITRAEAEAEDTEIGTDVDKAMGVERIYVPELNEIAFANKATDDVAKAWQTIAARDGAFRYATSNEKDLVKVLSTVDPLLKVTKVSDVKGVKFVDVVSAENPDSVATVMLEGKNIKLDISKWKTGDGGNRVYAALANWAYNTDRVFQEDDALSENSLFRRTENMMSAALKVGTTRHIAPGKFLKAGNKSLGVAPLEWTEGADGANMKALIDTTYENVTANIPALGDISFDLESGQFLRGESTPVTAAELRAIAAGPDARRARAGETTIKRALITKSLLRAADSEVGRRLLGQLAVGDGMQSWPAESTAKLLYSNKQVETPEFKRWFGDSKVVDEDGKPLVVYHGSADRIDVFKSGAYRGGTISFAFDKGTASDYAAGALFTHNESARRTGDALKTEPVIESVYLSIKQPFDGGVADHVSKVASVLESRGVKAPTGFSWGKILRMSQDADLETSEVVSAMKEAGFDGQYVNDAGKIVLNVFDPSQIKSATGNNGQFDPENPDIRFANKPTSKWVGEDGRWQFAPGKMVWDMFGKATGPLLDRIYLRSASTEVRHAIRKMKLDVQKAMETSSEMVGAMRQMPAEERNMISDIIERELKAGVTPSASAVQHAAMMNEAFETQTNELVRLGMLTQEAADRWRGKYLPRYYESKLSGTVSGAWADLIKFTRKGDTLKGIKGRHLRGRGMTQSIAVSELADYEAKGWEVRDKDFDPAVHDTVYVWRDFTKAEREKMGEIRDAGFRFTMGYMQTQKDIALGRMYEGISLNPDMASRTKPDDTYVQVPDTTVPETQAKRYGKLAGMWVSRNLMTQLSLQEEMESDALRLYRKALSVWKENKTVLNPVSHMNNFVSNLTMAHLAGVSYYDGHKYAGAIKDFASKAPMVKEAHDAGLFLGSMSEEELGKMLPLELQTLLDKQDSKALTGMRLAHTVLTWGLRRPAGIAYEFGDRFFKYLIYKDARKQGMEPQEAVDYAQKYIFTYDGLPKTARMIRDFAIPFFSYTYKAVPTLLETALTHPHRVVAPATLLAVASAAAYAVAAGGDDDWMDSVKKYITDADFRKEADALQESEYKLLPDWMRGRTSFGSQKTIRLGTDEATGNPVFLDTSRFIPGGDLFDVTGNAGGLPLIQPFTPSNPLLSTYAAMIGNKDMFTGKELVNKNLDTDAEAFSKRADWLWKMATPAIAINQAHWDRAVNAVAYAAGGEELPIPDIVGGNLTGIGKDGMPVQARYAALNTIGIKARPMDLDMSEQIQRSQQNKTLRDLDAQLRQARMQNAKGIRSDRNLEKTIEQIQLKKERLLDGLTVDGEARP